MSIFNNITQDFYDSVNSFGSNPFVLVVLIIIILIYYVIFAFLGNSHDSDYSNNFTSGGFLFIEAILWALFILLVFINGLAYFFNINVITELKSIFNKTPEVKIESTIDPSKNSETKSNVESNVESKSESESESNSDLSNDSDKNNNPSNFTFKEVYHVPGNKFTYHDAKAICKAFDGNMANYNQLVDAQKKGASWCSYGWTKDQLGLYPTSKIAFNKLKEKEGHKYDCGLPGINGGYVDNPHIKLGANCYGYKPKISELEKKILENDNLYPKTHKEKLFDERVKYWRERIGNILISPFNNDNWFNVPYN